MPEFARQYRIISLMILLSLFLSVMVSPVFAQEDNICRDAGAPFIEFDETLSGTLHPDFPIAFFCFDAERGTDVTITIEHTSANLNSVLIVGTPFIDAEGALVDEILFAAESPIGGSEYDGTVEIEEDGTYLIAVQGAQNVQGTFDITIEESGGLVLGGSTEDDNGNETDSDNIGEEDSGNTEELITNIVPGETNLCDTVFAVDMAVGDTVEDSTGVEPIFYCIEANESDIITIDFTIEDDVPMGFLVVSPFFEFAQDSVIYAQSISQVEGETASGEFLAPATGQYVIYVAAAVEAEGSFSMSVTSVAGNVYTCLNEPLGTLISREWGVLDAEGEPVIEINVACSERLSISAFGASTVALYNVTQGDQFIFVYENILYVTESLSETEWVFFREDDGTVFTLEALSDEDTCSDDDLLRLMQGSWLWQLDQTQNLFFDFTCNGSVIIDDGQGDPFVAAYEFNGDEIVIDPDTNEPLVFSNILLADDIMTVTFSGIIFELENLLYDVDTAETEAEATQEANSD